MKRNIIDNAVTDIRSRHIYDPNWTGTADFGRIVPFHIQELVGTDKIISFRPHIEMQMLPLASPSFGKMDLYLHAFFVPTRLLWKDYRDFSSERGVGKNATPPFITKMHLMDVYTYYDNNPDISNDFAVGMKRGMFKHWTSLGLPPFFDGGSNVRLTDNLSVLKFRAYQQIWWDYYRDPEVLRDESKSNYITTEGGLQTMSFMEQFLPRVRSINDSWISELFAESGFTDDNIMPVVLPDVSLNPGFAPVGSNSAINVRPDGNVVLGSRSNGTDVIGQFDEHEIRKAEALLRLSERMSLGGKRQIETLFAKFGIKPQWDKLEMCQYLGGAKETVLITDITSTSDTVVQPQGDVNLSAHNGSPLGQKAGTGYLNFSDFNVSFTATEPGYFVVCFSVMPHVHFVQGIDKSWYRNNLHDWFTKELEHTGQVAVSKKEIAVAHEGNQSYDKDEDDQTFAFTQPYYEYKHCQDILAGDFMKYHNSGISDEDGNLIPDLQYMQSMEMYVDYPSNRRFNMDNLLIDGEKFNKIFYYLGGSLFADVDDHFHLCIDKHIEMDRPMDGYAVPTLETTKQPHEVTQSVGGDMVL